MKKKILAILFALCLMTPVPIFAKENIYIGGESAGIVMRYDGVLISGTYTLDINGSNVNPNDQDIVSGDIIVSINGTKIKNLKELYTEVSNFQADRNEIPIQINRNDEILDRILITTYDTHLKSFKSGIYVKDEVIGVGTVTFYNESNHTIAALGHEVMDSDMKDFSILQEGTLHPSNVTSIKKSELNSPGEKNATIDYHETICDIEKNTVIGIYGHYEQLPSDATSFPTATQDEIQLGDALIYTVLENNEVETFHINITKINKQTSKSVKGIEFEVSDPTLLQQTNGIVQGMSGSPIVQNGKLIGAVTHVVTSNPKEGYGVFIEWMLEESNMLKND